MYEPTIRLLEAMNEELQEKADQIIRDIPVRLFVDGIEIDLEETIDHTSEVDRGGGEIHIHKTFGLKRMIQRHPDEYDEELHGDFFTKTEIVDLLSRGKK